MSKAHKRYDSIFFKKPDGSRTRSYITDVGGDPDSGISGAGTYLVVEAGTGFGYLIRRGAIVDPEQDSDAAAELRLIHDNDRKRSDLLSELLGRLGYYAQGNGRIVYSAEHAEDRQEELVRDLVDEFTTRRDAV